MAKTQRKKILFLGDSLTQGTLGVSYVNLLRRRLHNYELINAGKNGDTVIGLSRRLKKTPLSNQMDMIFVWIGVNDVLATISWNFPFWRIVLNEPWAQNHAIFKKHYDEILSYCASKSERIIAVSPLFIGEEYHNKWNRKLRELYAIIKTLAKKYESVDVFDIHTMMIQKVKGKTISSYLPKNIIRDWTDAITLHSIKNIDEKAQERGLHVTFDGVHLNSNGAEYVADAFLQLIEKKKE